MSEPVYCVFDFETFSEADLKKTGAWEYSVHPSTQILCAAWRIGTRKSLPFARTQTWVPHSTGNSAGLREAFLDPSVILTAHNSNFERTILGNVYATKYEPRHLVALRAIPTDRWLCTAAAAAALALPRALGKVAEVLGLASQKDGAGSKLILKWCKPKKPSKKDPSTRHTNPDELRQIVAYCATDVDTTVELFLRLPMLPESERRVWGLDQTLNRRGFTADRELIEAAHDVIALETAAMDAETADRTLGLVTSMRERNAALDFLRHDGAEDLPDLRAATVETALRADIPENAKRLLKIRQAVSRSSTAKYSAFYRRSKSDGRVRDSMLYQGASTGRWSSTGVQIHNLPRAVIKAPMEELIAAVKTRDPEWLRVAYGEPFAVLSTALRGVIKATEGAVLYACDYNAIEARALAWLAGHEAGLQAFRDGRDMYKELASEVFGVAVADVTETQRFYGKTLILGAGYQLGWRGYQAHCAAVGAYIDDATARRAIKTYRTENAPIQKLWYGLEAAAIHAVQNPTKKTVYGKIGWRYVDPFLYCWLPSDRCLAFHGAKAIMVDTLYGPKLTLHYNGTNSVTRKFETSPSYGGLLCENVTQATCRDLLAEAMLRVEAKGYEVLLSVHDEIIAESAHGDFDEFSALMSELPPWATGLPVRVTGFYGSRYKK